jgi:hypothetical protein
LNALLVEDRDHPARERVRRDLRDLEELLAVDAARAVPAQHGERFVSQSEAEQSRSGKDARVELHEALLQALELALGDWRPHGATTCVSRAEDVKESRLGCAQFDRFSMSSMNCDAASRGRRMSRRARGTGKRRAHGIGPWWRRVAGVRSQELRRYRSATVVLKWESERGRAK